MNQKSLFRNSMSFADHEQDDDENKKDKDKLKSIHTSDRDFDNNIFNNIIFNDMNENNNNWNKNKSNHSNIIQEYYQNVEDNIELFSNQFNNMNLSSNKEYNE
jgi:hypothetical protein